MISGGSLDNTSGGPMTLVNNNPQTWNGSFTFLGSSNLNLGSGTVGLNNNPTVTVAANTLTVGGVVSGTGGLTLAGGGTLVLSKTANTYSGGTTIDGGVLNITAGLSLGATSGTLTFANNGTLQAGAATVALSSSRNVVINSSATATLDTQANAMSIAGPISGPGNLTKIGAGTLTLTGSNTYGGTTINNGTLNINGDAALGSSAGSLTFSGNSTLQAGTSNISLNSARITTINAGMTATVDTQSYNMAIAGVVTGSGGLTKVGAGALTLGGNNSYYGPTTISNGSLILTGAANNSAVTVATSAGFSAQPGSGTTYVAGLTLNAGSNFDMIDGQTGHAGRYRGPAG